MKDWNCPGGHPMHFDHVNTTNPMERVYSSWDWQHEFKTFPELNQERQIDENGFISPMAMSQVLVCPPLLNEPERIHGMPWVEPYRKTFKRIGRNHTERRTILESWSLRDCPLHCLQAFYPWPGLTESRDGFSFKARAWHALKAHLFAVLRERSLSLIRDSLSPRVRATFRVA